MTRPEFGMVRTLRGYENFEDVYQGQPTSNPIYLSDRASGKDPAAERAFSSLQAQYKKQHGFSPPLTAATEGISPFLQRGVPVPFGSRVCILLPNVNAGFGEIPNSIYYSLMWRTRSLDVWVDPKRRDPFHQAYDGLGQTDDGSLNVPGMPDPKFVGAAAQRKLIVVSQELIQYAQAEPTTNVPAARVDMWAETLKSQFSVHTAPPLFPNFSDTLQAVTGDVQQGYTKNGVSGGNFPLYVPYLTTALGDELLIAVSPTAGGGGIGSNWNFDNAQYVISLLFGRAGYEDGIPLIATPLKQNPTLGVYVLTGQSA